MSNHHRFALILLTVFLVISALFTSGSHAARGAAPDNTIKSPEEFFGFRIGTDKKLARWDKIVEYMQMVGNNSDRIHYRELGKSTNNNPFIALEISSPDTIKNLDHYKKLEQKLYFQNGAPTADERDEIFKSGKTVVVVTCAIHATEIGASQMVLDLVYNLATDNSARVKKILDNVIFVLVPCLNPDGEIIVTDWYNKNVGTPYENSPTPWVYHPYVGHDNNRDMYMFTQKESQLTAKLLWHDWFPIVWLDEHQQGGQGARIFVMPATDPINPNVHPLIYRWNGIFGQEQGAALEAAGKEGIIYNSTYTNFWEGAMAWAGWWHNEVGLLTEVASARVASPTDQRMATPGATPDASTQDAAAQGRGGNNNPDGPLPPPRDVTPRTEYPRPWLGGHWTLRDIIDYELIATMATLETAADQRETLLRQFYEVNRVTVEAGKQGDVSAIIIPANQHDPAALANLIERLQMGGVEVSRTQANFEADGKQYSSGTFIIPMNQVFARYAKDILEKQYYPEVRRAPGAPAEAPYDVTSWSLGMLMGVDTVFVKKPLPTNLNLTKLSDNSTPVTASDHSTSANRRKPRLGMYQSWTSNMDEGWTRWVLEQNQFPYTTLHNDDMRGGHLRSKFDAIILPDQSENDIMRGLDNRSIRPEYKGGIGEDGLAALKEFVHEGGTLIAMGGACDLVIDKFAVPVRDLKRGLTREQHFAPGTIVRIQVDTSHPLGKGMPAETYGFYINSPFFALTEGFQSQKAAVVARYPNSDVLASGWLRGEDFMSGHAAVVAIENNPGRIILFGLRPQHRAQTLATFPLLFNALYWAAESK